MADELKNLTIRLADFCALLDVEAREVRYVLEEGFVPKGVAHSPSTGNHREFGPGHAFWLAIVVKLKQAGLKTPFAAEVADIATEGLQRVTQNLSWDWTLFPPEGWFDTDFQYSLDIGDFKKIRLVTNANPSKGWDTFGWVPITGRRVEDKHFQPFVLVRVDLTRIAKVFTQVKAWKCPHRQPQTESDKGIRRSK